MTAAGTLASHWNYRAILHPDGSAGIHEVHYREGTPCAFCETAICIVDTEALRKSFRLLYEGGLKALERPTINAADFS
jgi:hypothetical protein